MAIQAHTQPAQEPIIIREQDEEGNERVVIIEPRPRKRKKLK
jgi:hypothetical protein